MILKQVFPMRADGEDWRRIELIYHAALERAPEQRSKFVAEACGDNKQLCDEIESLLAQGSKTSGPFDRPAWDVLCTSFENSDQAPLRPGTQLGSYKVRS